VGPDNRAFNSSFAASFGDHTSGTGPYLLVDGATQANQTVWQQTVTGLARNRNYTFSFWLLNAVGSNHAQLQASANGVDVGPVCSNPADGGAWQLNTITVNPGNRSELVLRLRNLNLASAGNDFGLDDLGLVLQTSADVSTSLSGPTAIGAGQAVGPYTVAFGNAGPEAATLVTQTVSLPVGASLTPAQVAALPSGASYNSSTRTINFGAVASLPAGTSNSFSFGFTAPPTTGAAALSSAVTTTSVQPLNAQPDQRTLPLTVSAAAAPPTGCRPSYATGTASSGLSADYYAGYFADNLGFFSNPPALTRIDPQLNYTDAYTNSATGWGSIIPPANRASSDQAQPDYLNPENFSARYRGSIYLAAAGDYTFYLTSDDASYLWVDGGALAPTAANRLIDNGGLHGPTTRQATVTLSAGLHNVLVYFGEKSGGNVLTLEYSGGPTGLARQVVPNAVLCAGPTALPPTATAVTNAPAMPNVNSYTPLLPPAGTDPNNSLGMVSGFVIATLPAPSNGILYVGTTPVRAGQQLTSAQATTLTFDPEPTFVGNATFTFYAVANTAQLSNLPATYTIPVVGPVADVTTSLSGPGTLGAGVSSGTYTVVFSNNGPQSAEQVTQAVALPTGATMTAAQVAALPGSATYSPSANTITFRTVPVLRSNDSNTYTFSFIAPTTQGQAMVASTVGTSTGQGRNTAPDRAELAVDVVPGNFFVTNDDSNEVPGNAAKSGNLILNDANPANLANSAFAAQVVSNPSHGTLVLNADGSYRYTPAQGYLGHDSFSYRVNVPGATPPTSNVSTVSLNVYDASQVCLSGTGTNLLTNPSFTNGNTGFSSSYGYSGAGASSLVPEGLYMVGTDAHDYHHNFFGTGRTGPGDRFMIVNGSQDLSVVYQQTVTVQPNRYYTFSAYAASVNPGSPAQLGFVINGKSTSTVTELPTTVNSYVRISDLWFSGSNTSAVVEIRDVNKVRGGNDFGLDDLYIGTCAVSLMANNVRNAAMNNQLAMMPLSPMSATATNGPAVSSFTVQTLVDPAAGILYLNGAPVVPGQVVPRNQANQLMFDPRASFVGNAVFTYTATDASGAGSINTASFTIPVNAPLPVELTAFAAQALRNTDARLTWRTAQERNNDHFEVERSFDGRSFGHVATVAGHGTTSRPTDYAYTDANVGLGRTGTVYYRLRQVDTDGTTSFSPVAPVAFSAPSALGFYPNPTAGIATLDLGTLPRGTYQVTLVDATGRQVLSQSLAGAEAHPLQLEHLAQGTYLLVVRGGGLKLSQRVVRE